MTIKAHIKDYLKRHPDAPKGLIEDYVREIDGACGDTTGRRLREMTEDGEIIRYTKMVLIEGRTKEITIYRLSEAKQLSLV